MENARDDDLLPIGRFAAATQLSPKALRLYAERGLLLPAEVDPWSGYRYYRPEQIRPARLIRTMREMEMPLSVIREVLDASPDMADTIIDRYERDFAARWDKVQRLGDMLHQSNRIKENAMSLKVEAKIVPAQQVAGKTERVLVEELSDHIGRTLADLRAFVAEQDGEIAGPPFGIYHGQINHEEDGPIEICLPVDGSFRASNGIEVKEVPGGPAAVVTATGEQCAFPAILEAYDAAYDWIVAQGHEKVGSPREVWIGPGKDGPMAIIWLYN